MLAIAHRRGAKADDAKVRLTMAVPLELEFLRVGLDERVANLPPQFESLLKVGGLCELLRERLDLVSERRALRFGSRIVQSIERTPQYFSRLLVKAEQF